MPGHITFVVSTARRLLDHMHDIQLEGIVHLKPPVAVEKSHHMFKDPLHVSHLVAPFSSSVTTVRVGVRETLGQQLIRVVDGIGIE